MNFSALISVDELSQVLGDAQLRIVDCRFELTKPAAGEAAWRSERITGARYAHLEHDLSDMRECAQHGRHPLPDPTQFNAVLARLGITPATRVIAYDQDQGAYAARLWWLLRASGHPHVQVLDGGFAAWKAKGQATDNGEPALFPPAPSVARTQIDRDAWLSADEVAQALASSSIKLIDARGAPRFRGEVEPMDRVAGHVPAAINRPFTENLGADGRFHPPAVLREAFLRLLVGRSAGSVVHMCGSGVTACHNLLAMEVAGLTGSRLYSDSWSGWITDPSRPIATSQ